MAGGAAAVEAYAGWGGYGSSKAALDQVSAILGVEHPSLRVYAFYHALSLPHPGVRP